MNGVRVKTTKFELVRSSSQKVVLALEEISAKCLRGVLLAPKKIIEGDKIRLAIADEEVAVCGLTQSRRFMFDLGECELGDGIQLLEVSVLPGDPIEIPLEYHRFDGSLDIAEDVIVGWVVDARESEAALPVEVLIDGVPLGLEVAKAAYSQRDGRLLFKAPISGRWRDGQHHHVQARVVGQDFVFPATPLIFKAGKAGGTVRYRVEISPNSRVSGWVFDTLRPDLTASVSVLVDEKVLLSKPATLRHPVLAVHGMVPADCGFDIDISGWRIRIVLRIAIGDFTFDYPLEPNSNQAPYTLQDPSFDRVGICIVLSGLRGDVGEREEARNLLFAASEIAESFPVTVAFAIPKEQALAFKASLEKELVELIGRSNTDKMRGVDFVLVPESVLPSTPANDAQLAAHNFDLWARANQFSSIVASALRGILAYCGDAKRQGLAYEKTRLVVLARSLSVIDRLDNDYLLDDPNLLFSEALERRAIASADAVFAHGGNTKEKLREAGFVFASEVTIVPAPVGNDVAAMAASELAGQWLLYVGPLQTAAGLLTMCDTLDRLAAQNTPKIEELSVGFVGPQDLVRGKDATQYIRDRAKKWPFKLQVFPDLTWDSYRHLLSRLGKRAFVAGMVQLQGSPWDQLARSAGTLNIAVDPTRPDNPSAFARRLARALAGETDMDGSAQGMSQDLRSIISAIPAKSESRSRQITHPTPLVSVCISHFNRPGLLWQTLASIIANEYPNKEIIVLDDGSSMTGILPELSRIETWLSEHNGHIVRQDNRYLGAARNAAARAARGDLIIFMDDDNLAHPSMISRFVETQQCTGAGTVTSRFGLFDGYDRIDPAVDAPRAIGTPLSPDIAVGVISNCFGDATMLITREAFETVGGFTEDYGRGHEDWELYARIANRGIRQELIAEPLFWYRIAATSMLHGRESINTDLQRNIRAYQHELPPGIFRVVQLAQGLLQRWDRAVVPTHAPARFGLDCATRLAYGRVAVITRTKNRPILLKRAIQSVLRQTFQDWVLVIVNDGGEPEPVKQLIDENRNALGGRILLINSLHSTGMENASNAGITNSANEFVVIHDDDDTWEPNFLSTCIDHLGCSPPDVGGVVVQAMVVIEEIKDGSVVEHDRYLFKNLEAVRLTRLSIENDFPPISFLFRRKVMDAIGQFNGELPVLGDWDFHLRVSEHFDVDVIQEPLANYHHRVQGTNGNYGNTVVALKETHRIQRARYLNKKIRRDLSQGNLSEAQLLYLGEMFQSMEGRFDAVLEFMKWLEKLQKDSSCHLKWIEDIITQKQNM